MNRTLILGTVLLALLVGVTALAAMQGGRKAEALAPGFGRDWQCTPQEKGDPICIRPVAPSASAAQSRS